MAIKQTLGKNVLAIDWETGARTEEASEWLFSRGRENYLEASRLLVLGWKLNDQPTKAICPSHDDDLSEFASDAAKADLVIAHNAVFDLSCWRHAIARFPGFPSLPKNVLCTMTMGLNFNLPMSLAAMGKLVLKMEKGDPNKKIKGSLNMLNFRPSPAALEYCMNDVDICMGIYQALLPYMPDFCLSGIAADIILNFRGIPVDLDFCSKGKAAVERRKLELNAYAKEMTGGCIDDLGKKKKLCDAIGVKSLSAETLLAALKHAQALKQEKTERLIKMRLEYAATSGTKYESILSYAHGDRVYDQQVYRKQHAGRSGSFDTQFHNFKQCHDARLELDGNSIGEIGGKTRLAVKAPAGRKLWIADYSQAELRVSLKIAGCKSLLDDIEAGQDIYSKFASALFGKPLSEVGKGTPERHLAKQGVLGFQYGSGHMAVVAKARKSGVIINPADSQRAHKFFHTNFPQFRQTWAQWMRDVSTTLIGIRSAKVSPKKGIKFGSKHMFGNTAFYITLPSGRPIIYWNPHITDNDGFSFGIGKRDFVKAGSHLTENVAQGIVSDYIDIATQRLTKPEFQRAGIFPLLNIHDELVCEVPENISEDMLAKMRSTMTDISWPEFSVKMEVEDKLVNRWGE